MSFDIWIIYVLTILAFMSTPGPSQLLMLSNSMSHGFKPSLATAAGDLSANALQMLAAGLGLAALIVSSQSLFTAIKWGGVFYLLWLGIKMIMQAKTTSAKDRAEKGKTRLKALWLQGFLTSAANPKAIVFFASLFPQFISADAPIAPQLIILSLTYIAIDGMFLSAYGYGAGWIAKRFKGHARVWIERVGGGCMIGAAVLLGLKSIAQRS